MRHDSAKPGSLTHSLGGGSGRVADPVQRDGMRAPPGTEADVGMRRASARPWALTHLSSSPLSMSKSKIPAGVVVEITGVDELEIVEVGELKVGASGLSSEFWPKIGQSLTPLRAVIWWLNFLQRQEKRWWPNFLQRQEKRLPNFLHRQEKRLPNFLQRQEQRKSRSCRRCKRREGRPKWRELSGQGSAPRARPGMDG